MRKTGRAGAFGGTTGRTSGRMTGRMSGRTTGRTTGGIRGLVILMLLAGLLLTGCAGGKKGAREESSMVVGFSQLGAESSWRMANTASMEKAAKDTGFALMMENANQKQKSRSTPSGPLSLTGLT